LKLTISNYLYNFLLQIKPLSELFYVGQHVVAKVTQIISETITEIELSLDPKDIHEELTYKVIKAGMVRLFFKAFIDVLTKYQILFYTLVKLVTQKLELNINDQYVTN
jgi:hypothetical protein